VLAYIHPVLGALSLALLGYVGSLGLRARNDPRRARQYLRRHARLAPWMYACILASWCAGFASTWLLRRDLELGASTHLRIGAALVVAVSAGALSSRHMDRDTIRSLHPWFGVAAMLLAAAHVFFGLQITP
jgi:hypothetical protein